MKIKHIIILVTCILFLIVLPSIFFVTSNSLFDKNFVFANNINSSLEKLFPKNNQLLFKKGDFYYKMGMFDKALEIYNQVECDGDEMCQKLYHNIGNTYYKSADILDDKQKTEFYKNSVDAYQKSLNYLYNESTKKNYDFVLKKLQELMDKIKKQEQEKQKEEEKKKEEQDKQKEEEKKGEEKKSDAEKKEEKNQKGEEKKQEDKNGEKKQDQKESESKESDKKEQESNQKETESKESQQPKKSEDVIPKGASIQISPDELKLIEKSLTPEEKKEIQDYLQSLKDEEGQNREFNKPQKDQDIFDILGEDFSGGKTGDKKDW